MRANRRFLIAIETDPVRYHGTRAAHPRLLGKTGSEQMLAHFAADLAALLPATSQCQLAAAGALFDQTQVLRPGYPVFAALEKLLAQSPRSSDPGRLSLGAEDGRMTLSELQPEPQIPLGLLQLLPLLVSGRAETVQDIAAAMEHCFLEKGQVSAHTARWLESAFEIRINHARFMTLTDLNAMFRLQLEHFGFLPLWQLIDAALEHLNESFEVSLDNGQVFAWRDGAVHAAYQTFDHWAGSGGGRHMDSQRGELAGGYADWTRGVRQFLTMLRAHHVPIEFHLPQQPGEVLEGSYFVEERERDAGWLCAAVTEHSFAELGTICVTVVIEGRQKNFYPLRPEGLNDIQTAIRQLGLEGSTVAFPGSIHFDEKKRLLSAEPIPDSLGHRNQGPIT